MHDRFINIINSERPVLVDFYADWCAPCKMMPPILKEVKEEFKDSIRIIKVNVDHNPKIASKFQIQSIPTLLIFQNGEIRWKGMGVQSVSILSSKIKQLILA